MRLMGFVAVAGMALAILAAVTLLPAWRELRQARVQQDVLSRNVELNNRVIEYNQQLIAAVQTDPLVIERLLMELENYRRPGETAIPSPSAAAPTPLAQMLAAQSPQSTLPATTLMNVADRLSQPRTRRGLLFLAGLLIVLAMICFGPATRHRT